MWDVIIKGIAFGAIVNVLSLGPVFFALVQSSIRRGVRAGATLALGVMLSDVFLIIVAYWGVSLFTDPTFRRIVGIIGGMVLIIFGIVTIIKSRSWQEQPEVEVQTFTYPALLAKGFILNVSNPSVIFFWMIVVGLMSAQSSYNLTHLGAFFSAALLTVLSLDCIKAYVAQRISNWLKPKFLLGLYRLVGLVLTGFGIFILFQAIS